MWVSPYLFLGHPFILHYNPTLIRFKVRWLEHFSSFEVLLIRLQSPLCKARILKILGSFWLFLGHLAGFFLCTIHRWCDGRHLDPKYFIRTSRMSIIYLPSCLFNLLFPRLSLFLHLLDAVIWLSGILKSFPDINGCWQSSK